MISRHYWKNRCSTTFKNITYTQQFCSCLILWSASLYTNFKQKFVSERVCFQSVQKYRRMLLIWCFIFAIGMCFNELSLTSYRFLKKVAILLVLINVQRNWRNHFRWLKVLHSAVRSISFLKESSTYIKFNTTFKSVTYLKSKSKQILVYKFSLILTH